MHWDIVAIIGGVCLPAASMGRRYRVIQGFRRPVSPRYSAVIEVSATAGAPRRRQRPCVFCDMTGTVTLVTSNDEIKFSGSNHNLQPWDAEGLLAFSNEVESFSDAVVKLSGSGRMGIVYAPNGLIEIPGSGNANVDGALIGMSVKITGSGASIMNTGGYSFGSASVSLLV